MPQIFSVDDHVLEPPTLWQDRLPLADRDSGPRVVLEDGREFWIYEDTKVPSPATSSLRMAQSHADGEAATDLELAAKQAIRNSEEWVYGQPVLYEDMRPGCYDPAARVADMDLDGVLASMVFPSYPRFCGQVFLEAKDKDLALRCLRIWNDWILDEWCPTAPGRLVPLSLVPLWDASLAAAEIERTAAKGSRGVIFSENVAQLGMPSIHDKDGFWEPLFAASSYHEMPLCLHIGSSSGTIVTAADSPAIITMALVPFRAQSALVDWTFSGVFIRHPELKIVLSEGGIGWIPYVLERMDQDWVNRGGWIHTPLKEPPSTLFADHVYGCFIDDEFGGRNLQDIGFDNVMIETDYPHPDSSFPNSVKTAEKAVGHLDPAQQFKILRGTAERLFHFEPHL